MWLGVHPLASRGRPSPFREVAAVLAAALIALIYLATPPAAPSPMPTSDLYTHLSVARNLLRGEGFATDIAYPLSFAYDFARELPQPLIHRAPGFGLLLTGPVWTAGADPTRTLRHVRWLQSGLLFLLMWLGLRAYLQRGHVLSLLLWFMLLKSNLLCRLALDWSLVEVPCAVILLALWLRLRDRDRDLGPLDGVLWGGLALLRPDLTWVPLLWGVWVRRATWISARLADLETDHPAAVGGGPRFFSTRLKGALLVVLLMVTPWLVRNTLVTGNPLFSLQAQAELVKDTRTWPQYSVYKQLEPQPLVHTLREDPTPVARKFVRGLRFYAQESAGLLQIPQLGVGVLILGWVLLGPWTRKLGPPPPGSALASIALAMGTGVLLGVQYAFFDHSLRHLLVLLPILTWELAPVFSDNLVRNLLEMGRPAPLAGRGLLRGCLWPLSRPYLLMGLVAVMILLSVFPLQSPTGWPEAVSQARSLAPLVDARAANLAAVEDSVPFVEWSATVWYADRPAVWDPGREPIRQQIRAELSHGP